MTTGSEDSNSLGPRGTDTESSMHAWEAHSSQSATSQRASKLALIASQWLQQSYSISLLEIEHA